MSSRTRLTGCNYVLCVFAWGTISHHQALRSMQRFTQEVMPAFSGAPASVG